MGSHEQLREARLQIIPISMLEAQFQNVLARSSQLCDAEWGTRADDGALVFHFFPPGYAANDAADWPSWTRFRDRIERAALQCFDLEHVFGDYAEELKSFSLIIKPPPRSPDLTSLIERFFSLLEAESEKPSETIP
jgi:hypothetical protein